MGIRDNVGGGARENGGVWVGFIVEGNRSVGSVIASVVVYILGFYFSVNVFR